MARAFLYFAILSENNTKNNKRANVQMGGKATCWKLNSHATKFRELCLFWTPAKFLVTLISAQFPPLRQNSSLSTLNRPFVVAALNYTKNVIDRYRRDAMQIEAWRARKSSSSFSTPIRELVNFQKKKIHQSFGSHNVHDNIRIIINFFLNVPFFSVRFRDSFQIFQIF